MKKEELGKLFENIPMDKLTREKQYEIKDKAYALAVSIWNNVPDSREQSLAFTKLEEAVMWANKGLSRHG